MLAIAQACYNKADYAAAFDWAGRAEKTGLLSAKTQRGVWLAIGDASHRDEEMGADLILGAASESEESAMGVAPTLHALGVGVPRDWDKAIALLLKAAKAGHTRSQLQTAMLLRALPRTNPIKNALLYSAATGGDTTAQFMLGLHLLETGTSDDRSNAIGWIIAAADAGNRAALLRAPEFIGEKMRHPAAPSLPKRIPWSDLHRFITLPHLADLPPVESISTSPAAGVRRGLISQRFADYIIGSAAPLLTRATVNDASAGEITDDTRTNSYVNFRLLESDLITASVNELIMRAMKHPLANGDPLSLLQYDPGQQYAPHYDYFDPEFPAHRPQLEQRGQRTKTGLLYLNSGYEGGVTRFHEAGIDFKGAAGDFLQFNNVLPDGAPDKMTLHSGEPPTSGEKWILSKWARGMTN